jgi:hypothetical protein
MDITVNLPNDETIVIKRHLCTPDAVLRVLASEQPDWTSAVIVITRDEWELAK